MRSLGPRWDPAAPASQRRSGRRGTTDQERTRYDSSRPRRVPPEFYGDDLFGRVIELPPARYRAREAVPA